MPVIKSAKKKLRVDKKRASDNKKVKSLVEVALSKAEKKPSQENINAAFSIIDKGVKKNIFHKNKGSRLKSRLSKLLTKKAVKPTKSKK